MLYIFDWDGTLSDSTSKITSAMQAAMADLGHPPKDANSVKQIIGLGLPEAVKTLIPGIDENGITAMRDRYVHHFEVVDPNPPNFYPNVLDTLNALLEEGHELAIATGKSRRGLNKILSELEVNHLFRASRCADETASKPNPKMLFELIEEFSVQPRDAVMIGDTSFDLEMAKRANIPSVAVDYGAHSVEKLEQFNPVNCISCISELLNIDFD